MAQDSFEFRRFILKLANKLNVFDRESLEYLLEGKIAAGKIEYLRKTATGLFDELQKGGLIGPANLKFLQKLLGDIGRQDLVGEVEIFEHSCRPRLTVKTEQFLEHSGYRLRIKGGKHMVSDKGDQYVCLRSGQSYKLVISNFNNERCRCRVEIDGHVVFPNLVIKEEDEISLDRPCHTASHFTSFAVKDAPPDSGIDERNAEDNGRIQVTFTPEVAKMTLTCDVGDGNDYSMTCPVNMTDVEFHQRIWSRFGCFTATIIICGICKPLGKRNRKLTDYGIEDGSHFRINFGLVGGVTRRKFTAKTPESIPWIPAATTMQGESEQTFKPVFDFRPNHKTRKVVLHLRLVARADENPLPSSEKCSPFVLGNRIPPPV